MVAGIAKGHLRLTVDEAGLSAMLDFAPDPAGAEWSAEKLYRLALEHRVSPVLKTRVDSIVLDFSQATSPKSASLAIGEPPIDPLPEEVAWEALEIPAEMAEHLDETILAAPPPEIVRVRTETVDVEKIVRKPGALPFLPGREERVTVQEKREVKERVPLDFTVVRTGWARKGDKLGVVYPPKPGKPGRNVFGKSIPAPQITDTSFYAGSGIARGKGELVAEIEGFVRIGKRWADIVPVVGHSWEVSPSKDRTGYALAYSPGDEKLGLPSAREILDAAIAMGADPETLASEGEITRMLAEASASGTRLEAAPISLGRDASIEVTVSEDRLRASLTLRKGRGKGRPLDLNEVARSVSARGFAGLDSEKFRKTLIEFWRSDEIELVDFEIAKGKAPTAGKDRELDFRVAFLPEDRVARVIEAVAAHPKAKELVPSLGEVPVGAADRVSVVQKGQLIASLSPPTKGAPGTDVFGGELPAIPGAAPPMRWLEGVDFDGVNATAASGGVLDVAEGPDGPLARVIPKRDAAVDARVASDRMSATVSMQSESGLGAPLSEETVLKALESRGVRSGVDREAIRAAIAAARESGFVDSAVVARGTPPVAEGGREIRFAEKAQKRGDSTSFEAKTGQVLLVATAGGGEPKAGCDVYGDAIPAPTSAGERSLPVPDSTIKVERNAKGDERWTALADGIFSFGPSGASVRAVREIEGDVTPATGHVTFPGSLRVAGSVASGLKVVCGGDLRVEGPVAAALLSSDGSVLLASGMRGGGRGVVRAKKGIMALFAEQATLMAVGDVRVRDHCARCEVKTNGRLSLLGERGRLAGGTARAKAGVDAAFIGATDGARTYISFGQDFLVRDMIETEEREIARIQAKLVEVDRMMRELERDRKPLDDIRAEKVAWLKTLEKYSIHVFNLRERAEEFFPAEIRARQGVMPGVVLECHNRVLEVTSPRGPTAFRFDPDNGRIVEAKL